MRENICKLNEKLKVLEQNINHPTLPINTPISNTGI